LLAGNYLEENEQIEAIAKGWFLKEEGKGTLKRNKYGEQNEDL
jgi:hypothetical protein